MSGKIITRVRERQAMAQAIRSAAAGNWYRAGVLARTSGVSKYEALSRIRAATLNEIIPSQPTQLQVKDATTGRMRYYVTREIAPAPWWRRVLGLA
jgi:hypothetical protein